MSGGLTSLESAIRTCKVNTGNAERIESDRFLGGPDKRTCPPFMGTDLIGRQVCADSFMTKSRGCNTASDRVYIENTVERPHYYEYINLNPDGINDDETIEGFGFGLQDAAYIREGFPNGASSSNGVFSLPSDLKFNGCQPGPFNNIPQSQMQSIPHQEGMPYSQLYAQDAENRRVKQALLTRESIMQENPLVDENPLRMTYRQMGYY